MEAPSVETVTKLLIKCEQGVHREGWEQSPMVCAVVWQPGSVLTMYDAEIPVAAPTPEKFMHLLGHNALADPSFGEAVQTEIGSSFFGWAHVWTGYYPTSREMPVDYWTATVGKRDNYPDAVEVRIICAVDLLGRPYLIRRIRGQKPRAYDMFSEVMPFNKIHEGLGNMVLGCVKRMPWAADYELDLEEFALPRLADLAGISHPVG